MNILGGREKLTIAKIVHIVEKLLKNVLLKNKYYINTMPSGIMPSGIMQVLIGGGQDAYLRGGEPQNIARSQTSRRPPKTTVL